jgi:hypothetical protein
MVFSKTSSTPLPAGYNIAQIVFVDLTAGMSAAQVAQAMDYAIYGFAFQVPNLNGLFLRSYDPSAIFDPDANMRTSFGNCNNNGAITGTLQFDQFASHNHVYAVGVTNVAGHYVVAGATFPLQNLNNTNTQNTGLDQTNPTNISVKYVIKY